MRWLVLLGLLVIGGCDDGGGGDAKDMAPPNPEMGIDDAGPDSGPDGGPQTAAERLAAVPETESWTLPGLSAPVQVVRTEMGIPHLYAANRNDLGRALGFVVARDRYFIMDLQRRLGLGTLTALLGDVTLENDLEARMTGMTFVADRVLEHMSPEMGAYLDAFAGGVNTYIEQVASGKLPPPSELRIAAPLLDADSPAALMQEWDRRSLAGMVAVVMYQTTFETGDVGRQRAADSLETLFTDPAIFQSELRRTGYLEDIWNDVSPHLESASAAGLGLETAEGLQPGPLPDARQGLLPRVRRLAPAQLTKLADRMSALEKRLGKDRDKGFGSNAWAVAGTASTDGAALVAGDGHLQLSVPALMYQIGLDTAALGGGDVHQTGLLLTGLPVLAVGTNGKVAWSQVNPVFDITDWYREEIQLGEDGRPSASMFQGDWKDLVAVDETYEIANIPALDSVGRTDTWTRWTTFDGRFIVSIEGRAPEEGETGVNMQGDLVVPEDVDGDGVISAISFDYAAFDATNYVDTLDRLGFAGNVAEFREATRGLVGSGLFSAAGDSAGDVLFTAFQGVPCRGYLARDDEGRWLPGADPTQLLDGTQYGGFRLPMRDGAVDPEPGRADPYACVVPFESVPQALSPARGYVHTANNDPGGLTHDGRLDDDPWYLGGPWSPTRAHTIARDLEKAIGSNTADVAAMSATQGNRQSRLGEMFADELVAAVQTARAAADIQDEPPAHLMRLADLYRAEAEAFDDVADRLSAWADGEFQAASGVETVYHQPDEQDRADAVATMIFNAWLPRFISAVFDDEGITGWRFSASRMRVRALRDFLAGRGAANPGQLASWFADTEESIFFDRLGTEDVERSDELMLIALTEALEFLRGEPEAAGEGGFGSLDMATWLWGLRHQARLESLLGSFLGEGSSFAIILQMFNITTRVLPLTEERLDREDPRSGLTWFPRPGDNWGVDAGNPGFSGTRFTHGNGPVMRMVISLKDGEVEGVNIVPGGQSGLTDSPHFADQARLWLANETIPLRFSLDQVLEGAEGREAYLPE